MFTATATVLLYVHWLAVCQAPASYKGLAIGDIATVFSSFAHRRLAAPMAKRDLPAEEDMLRAFSARPHLDRESALQE